MKYLHRAAEDILEFVAGDVFVKAVAHALGVGHLAQHAPIGGGDALDGVCGQVRVEVNASSVSSTLDLPAAR